MRADGRTFDELRPVKIKTDYLDFAEASAFIEVGKTRVLAAASVEERVPPFLRNIGSGWVTAEYSMLPCSTEKRTLRERNMARISGRSQEIQRLIGRSLRSVTDLASVGERTIILDCDVIQADGGTRAASITAACVALALIFKKLLNEKVLSRMPLQQLVSGISLGIVDGEPLLDLDYQEDSKADIDMNVIGTSRGKLVEVQVTAEKNPFSNKELNALLKLADKGIRELIEVQKGVLRKKKISFKD